MISNDYFVWIELMVTEMMKRMNDNSNETLSRGRKKTENYDNKTKITKQLILR